MYLLLCTILFILSDVNCDYRTEYYANLINSSIAEALVYELPQSNAEFKSGSDSANVTDYGSFDFIIVGAGAAGNVLATRLSEIDNWRILLLEAGGEENDFNSIPALFGYLQFSKMNWGYFTTPQTNCCLGMRDQKCMVPRGKAIGGSTAIHASTYTRGNRKDFDKWVELGNPGWSYEEVLPYFIKSENVQVHGDHGGYRGKGGYWNVEYSFPPMEAATIFFNASTELNITFVDCNGAHQIGTTKSQLNTRHGRRQSTGTAFLDNARKRDTPLRVVTRALVTKIDIDKDSKVAQDVTFVKDNIKYTATARKEVLLSAGSINSPQLLMLSGIGPRDHLEEIGIEVVQDLPVGKNLIDHPFFQGLAFRTNLTYKETDLLSQIESFLDGYGPLTIPSNVDVIGFRHGGDAPEGVPMIEYLLAAQGGLSGPITPRVNNWNPELVEQYYNRLDPHKDIFLHLVLLHEKSRGRVTLKSNDPIDFPNIDLNLFSEPEDIDNMIEGIEFLLHFADTEAFRKINATLVDVPICAEFEKYSREFWECTLRKMSATIYHPVGTTAIGPSSETSVVDTNLKVHGIKNLRIVDAGVFPSSVSGHTAAAVVMVAEKISDAIKKNYNVTNDG